MITGCFFIDFLGPRFLECDQVKHDRLPEDKDKKTPTKADPNEEHHIIEEHHDNENTHHEDHIEL